MPENRRPNSSKQMEKLIELRDDRNPIPPSIGTSSLQGIFFGPLAGQPSSINNPMDTFANKIDGWLFLPVCAIYLSILSNAFLLITPLCNISSDGLNYVNIINLCSLVFGIFTAISINKRFLFTRKLTILFFSAHTALKLYDMIITLTETGPQRALSANAIYFWCVGLLLFLCSTLYCMFSYRVKATFPSTRA